MTLSAPPATRRSTRAEIGRSLPVLALLVALLLPVFWLRAGSERSLWIDEIHSLQLVQLPVPRLLDESARDFHPPGYALALKTWLKALRILGFEPGLAAARALNVFAWLGATALLWGLATALLGRGGGALLTICIAGSAAAAVVVRDVRGYAFPFLALAVAILLLAALRRAPGAPEENSPWRRGLGWAAYAVALTVALWSHLLAAPAVAALALAWLAMAVPAGRRGEGWCWLPGLSAHAVPWLLFLPWLLRVPGQVAELQQAAPVWMTPPTVSNLGRVFAWWLPLGRISPPTATAEPWLLLLGTTAVLVPIAVGLWALRSNRLSGPARTIAGLAVPVASLTIVAGWALARWEIAATFHGPRYPMLVAGVFAAGLGASALAGTRSLWSAGLALAPWFVASAVAHGVAIRQESIPGGLVAFRPTVEQQAAPLGNQVYVVPSELAPFVRKTFGGLDLRPVEDLVCAPPASAALLDVNPWPALDRTRDQVLAHAVSSGSLARTVERIDWKDAQTEAVLYLLGDLDAQAASRLCERGLQPLATAPPDAVATARPEDQLAGDGWSYLELDDHLDARRWATRSQVKIRFDRSLPAGDYVLHLRGVRLPYPQESVELRLTLRGAAPLADVTVPPGPFELALPVTLNRRVVPILRVSHQVWSPAVETGSGDTRSLSFLFDAAWLRGPDAN